MRDEGSPTRLVPALPLPVPIPGPDLKLKPSLPEPPLPKMPDKFKPQWNTKNLGLRLGSDAVAASSAAGLVAPLIAIIDQSIMENASGRSSLLNSLKSSLRTLLLRPHTLVLSKPFALLFMVYGGTFLTANTLDTLSSTVLHPSHSPASVTSGTPKFLASSTANIGLCIYKDSVFARLFGPTGVTRPVPALSLALFAVRDCLTIFASFNVPPLLGPVLTKHLGEEGKKWVGGQTVAQFAAPAAVQAFSTPLHLLGLDIYNRPRGEGKGGGPGWRERWEIVRKNWGISVAARVCRIVPAFGVGGVVNLKVRKGLMERLA